MGNEWNELINETSLNEQETADSTQETASKVEFVEKEVYCREIECTFDHPWRYERAKFAKMLGWKTVKRDVKTSSYGTGKQEIVQTSEKTYEIREKINYSRKSVFIMRLDKTKISDQKRYAQLEEEISEFLTQAETKFGENISPALLSDKEWLRYALLCDWQIWLLCGVMIFPLPFVFINRIYKAFTYRKKHASYQALADAYHNKAKEFEEEIKKIAVF